MIDYEMNDDQKEWTDWCELIEEDDADRAYDRDNVEAFNGSCLDAYDLDNITDVREVRSHYQWCRIWSDEDARYEWRWITRCSHCGSARCRCPTRWWAGVH